MTTFYLNGKDRNSIKGLAKPQFRKPRTIQVEAIERITDTINRVDRLLVNMPCRTGKTYTLLYAAEQAAANLVIVLCGKASAKSSYKTDSAWLDENGNLVGFNKVFTENDAIKEFLNNPKIALADKILIELTPQLLNCNPELTNKLASLVSGRKAVFAFDEAHFAEQTKKTTDIVNTLTTDIDAEDDAADATGIAEKFNTVPRIFLTASPDTESLQKKFSFDQGNYYELTKEREWELYQEDLTKPVEDREFNYVPVRGCLYVMDQMLDSVFDADKGAVQDYVNLFTKPIAKSAAQKFLKKALRLVVQTINIGPDQSFMKDEAEAYTRRGTNINLMVKCPVNPAHYQEDGLEPVSKKLAQYITDIETEILTQYPEFTEINILDVTLTNNTSQEQANAFFDEHPTGINIILTQQRLIEGTTLPNLDGFLYFCISGSLAKYKQESGRVLTPVAGKRFGFVFFFDEQGLSKARSIISAKQKSTNKKKKKLGRRLSADVAKKLTRVNPAFVVSDKGFKLVDYSQSLHTKDSLERAKTNNTLFDKQLVLGNTRLKELIQHLLGKATNNTAKRKATTGGSSGAGSSGNSTTAKKNTKNTVTSTTPISEITLEKFVQYLMYLYQDCIQLEIDAEELSEYVLAIAVKNDIPTEAITILYDDDDLYDTLMEIYEVLSRDQSTINPEAENND